MQNPYDLSNPQTFLSVRQEAESEPLGIDIDLQYTAQLYSIVHSISKDESTSYFLVPSPDEKGVQYFNQSKSINLDRYFLASPQFYGQTIYQIQENQSHQIDINKIYDEMKIKNFQFPQNLLPELIFEKIISFSDVKIPYSKAIFLHIVHKFLVRAIIEICQGDTFLFHRSIIKFLAPELQIGKEFHYFGVNVLIDVIGKLFVDNPIEEPQHYELNLHMMNHPEWYPFIHLLCELVLKQEIAYQCVRMAVGSFRPSLVSEHIVIMMACTFLTALPTSETFSICQELFGTKFLFHCFRDPSTFCNSTQPVDLSLVYPFLFIHSYFMQYFNGSITLNTALSSIKNIGEKSLFDSNKILKCFVDPLIENIYQKYILLKSDPGYLEISKFQSDAIQAELVNALPIFKECITNDGVALGLLNRVQNIIRKHDYLPKGIALTLYSFIYNFGICKQSVFNTWFDLIAVSSRTSSGILIELNTLMNGQIRLDLQPQDLLTENQ